MDVCGEIKPKRFLLLGANIIFMLIEEDFRNNTYIFCSVMFLFWMVIFINFPSLVLWSNLKPVYYEEMNIDFEKLPKLANYDITKKKYKNYFSYVLMVSNSSLLSILLNYWFIQTKGITSFYEIIGVTGGIVQVFYIVNLCSGTGTLYLLKYLTAKEKIVPIEGDDED